MDAASLTCRAALKSPEAAHHPKHAIHAAHISLPVIGFVCTSAKRHSYSIWGRSSTQRMGGCRSASWFSRLHGLAYHEPKTGTVAQTKRRNIYTKTSRHDILSVSLWVHTVIVPI